MAALWYPLAGARENADERQAVYANMVVHLYQSTLVPSITTTLAELNAAEADFSGYATETMVAWFDPIFAPASGYLIQSPQVQFAFDSGLGAVTNTVGGAYFVDATGDLRLILALQPAEYIGFATDGDGWTFNIIDVFPTGFSV